MAVTTIEQCYAVMGGDWENFIGRIKKPELAQKLLFMFLRDTSYNDFVAAVSKGDLETAFRMIHTLKGVALNLGITKLGTSASNLTEALRPTNQRPDNATLIGLIHNVKVDYTLTVNTINEFKSYLGL